MTVLLATLVELVIEPSSVEELEGREFATDGIGATSLQSLPNDEQAGGNKVQIDVLLL